MSGPESVDRRNITFAQAIGEAPLPQQLAVGDISQEFRARVWAVLHAALDDASHWTGSGFELSDPWKRILRDWHVNHEYRFADEFSARSHELTPRVKQIVAQNVPTGLLTFLEFVLRRLPDGYVKRSLVREFEICRTAYRFIDESIIVIGSAEDAKAISTAFAALHDGRFAGARAHLHTAGEALTAGKWADSVRESIHAVEGAARVIAPGTQQLGPALHELSKSGTIAPVLKSGFEKLYGWTNSEQGIRHALLDAGDAAVGEAEAMYMFGACAAFITYLVLKDASAS